MISTVDKILTKKTLKQFHSLVMMMSLRGDTLLHVVENYDGVDDLVHLLIGKSI